jgi:putative hydrolase of the HAD superfamily
MEAVIFDWGGTLSVWAQIDIEDMWRLAARRIDAARQDEVVAKLIEVEGRSWARTRTDRRSTRLADLLAEASAALGADVAGAVLEEAEAHHLDTWTPHIQHQPDAARVLGELRAAGYRIGLLSNTHWPRHFHEHFLERDGLAELIDVRCYTSEMEWVKPDERAFAEVKQKLGVTSGVFVGDRRYDDVLGARQAGLRSVWVRNDRDRDDEIVPDAAIDTLSELPAVVDQLVRQGA